LPVTLKVVFVPVYAVMGFEKDADVSSSRS
jgi:hypothetical protein